MLLLIVSIEIGTFVPLHFPGIEIMYEQYCPMVLNIEVLRLEKRLDEKLWYLRDCDPIHSTVPLDMQPELIADGSEVPVNPIKVHHHL